MSYRDASPALQCTPPMPNHLSEAASLRSLYPAARPAQSKANLQASTHTPSLVLFRLLQSLQLREVYSTRDRSWSCLPKAGRRFRSGLFRCAPAFPELAAAFRSVSHALQRSVLLRGIASNSRVLRARGPALLF